MSDKKTRTAMVLYTDGGARPSRGMAGAGVHGYTYDPDEFPDKPQKKVQCPTDRGYAKSIKGKWAFGTCAEAVDKQAQWVKPLQYIDIIHSYPQDPTTNNQAELDAIILALEYAKDADKVLIYSDSQTTVKGLTQWYKNWIANNWVSSQGKPVANSDQYKKILALLNPIRDKVAIEHIPAHAGFLGNELADGLATRGIFATQRSNPHTHIQESEPQGYWNKKEAPHRFLANNKLYFMTNDDYQGPLDKDYRVYYLGTHGNKDEVVGKRASDHALAVVLLKDKDPVVETLVKEHIRVCEADYKILSWIEVGNALSKGNYNELLEYGANYLGKHNHQPRVINHNDEVYTDCASPARLAYRVVDKLNAIEGLLEMSIKMINTGALGESYYIITDVTDQFYDVDKKDKLKLKTSIGQSSRAINLNVDVGIDRIIPETVRLTFGLDMPIRNTFSGLTDQIEGVYVLCVSETMTHFMYYLIIKTKQDEWGMWCSPHANMKLMS